jgi:hypothetical protein
VAVAAFDGGAATTKAATPATVNTPIAAARAARRVRWVSMPGVFDNVIELVNGGPFDEAFSQLDG